MQIFHIVDRGVWMAAVGAGEYVPAALDADGFVHFSFADQVAGTANGIYRDEPDPIVVEVDSDAVPHELRIEDSYGSGAEFPHVYGPIPVAAATRVHEMTRDGGGDWVFSPDAANGPSSTDR